LWQLAQIFYLRDIAPLRFHHPMKVFES
jgi:hypothetical protein